MRRDRLISRIRTGIALFAILVAWMALGRHWLSAWWIAAPLVAFIVVAAIHERVVKALRRAERAVAFYDAGLRRLEHRWMGRGVVRDDFAPAGHPYAADLDLFGRGSLFDLLCAARTTVGQQRLASWLLEAVDIETIQNRQAAVRELSDRLDFREDLALLGEETPVDAGVLLSWGEAPPQLAAPWVRAAAVALALGGAASLFAWWPLGFGPLALVVTIAIGQIFLYRLRPQLSAVLGDLERSTAALGALSGLFERLEREPFSSPLLARLQSHIQASGAAPSVQIRRLQRLLDWLELQGSLYFAPFARLLLWSVHCALAVEGWRRMNGPYLRSWIDAIAEFEALASLAGYTYEHPEDPFPEFETTTACLVAEQIGHPLLAPATLVRNSVALDARVRLYVVSGSNMSGKSTLLRTVGINAVLAFAGAPVRAERLRLSRLQIGASLRTQDSLQGGVSRFYAEIVRLRQIVALTQNETQLLFLLDEVLHGTNSHDRLIGAEAIARSLVRQKALGFITTHDLALARLEGDPELHAVNVHFEDQLVDAKMTFDYRLRPGVVERSNALELMRAVGLDI